MHAGLSVNSGLEAVIVVQWAGFRAEVSRERAIMGEIESGLTRARAEGEDSKMQREEELRIGQEDVDRAQKDLEELEEAVGLTGEFMHLEGIE